MRIYLHYINTMHSEPGLSQNCTRVKDSLMYSIFNEMNHPAQIARKE